MVATHPLATLLAYAIRDGGPREPATTKAMCQFATQNPWLLAVNNAWRLYVRDDLSAEQALAVRARYTAAGYCTPRSEAMWSALYLMRPEAHPELLTAADVAAWPANVASAVASLRVAAAFTAPTAVLVELTHRSEGATRLTATNELRHAKARDAAIEVGRLGTAGMSVSATDRITRNWLTPAVRELSRAANPATSAAQSWARTLAVKSALVIPNLSVDAVRALAAAWHRRVAADKLGDDPDTAALVAAGTNPVVGGQPVRAVAYLSDDQLSELCAAVDSRSVTNPGVWDSLSAVIPAAGTFPGTWDQLLDALDAVAATPVQP